jgi:hypothetical protein
MSQLLDFLGPLRRFRGTYENEADSIHLSLRTKAHHLLLELSKISEVIPSSLFLKRVKTSLHEPPIGQGVYADVFLGMYNNCPVALKRLRIFGSTVTKSPGNLTKVNVAVIDFPQDSYTAKKKFAREALLWRQLRHKNILPLLGIDADVHAPYMCMVSKMMDDGDLLCYVRRKGVPNADIIRLVCISGLTKHQSPSYGVL